MKTYISAKVYRELYAIITCRSINMMDRPTVLHLLKVMGYKETLNWAANYKEEYYNGVINGFEIEQSINYRKEET